MIPPEMYWPHDMLAAAMPDKYGHLIQPQVEESESAARLRKARASIQTVEGGCQVYRPIFGDDRPRKAPWSKARRP